jgi:predicted PurR-regulated permease PerM
MRKIVGLHPVVTLLALMIGFRIAGIGGSLLAVPVVLFCKVLIEQFFLPQRKRPSESQ